MTLNNTQKQLIYKHLDLVIEKNKVHNLTSIKNVDEAVELHVEDSLAALTEINNINPTNILDMGSGGGFPGITLAIATGIPTTLVETTRKKCDCLEFFINQLVLEEQISVINDRVENVSSTNKYKWDLVTARALSSLPSLVELASPLLKYRGYLLAYKGASVDEEIGDTNKICEKLGLNYVSCRKYTLPKTNKTHYIVLYQKVSESKIKLPRKLGLAQKRPLIN